MTFTKVSTEFDRFFLDADFTRKERGSRFCSWTKWVDDASILHDATLQQNWRDGEFIFSLVVWTESRIWKPIRRSEDDELVDTLHILFVKEGCFPPGTPDLTGWPVSTGGDDLEVLGQRVLEWFESYQDRASVISALEKLVKESEATVPRRRFFGWSRRQDSAPTPSPHFFERLGDLYYQEGDPATAVSWLDRWLECRSQWAERQQYLERVNEIKGTME